MSDRHPTVLLLALSLGLLGSCNSGGSGATAATGPNRAPTAEWATVSQATTGIALTLNGSASSDPDGDELEFYWELLSRPSLSSAVILGPRDPIASLTPDVVGQYEVQLVVSDGALESPPRVRSIDVTSIEVWEPTYGPTGGRIEALTMLPGPGSGGVVWYAGVLTQGSGIGLYRSLDQGLSWARVRDLNEPLITTDILALAGDASDTLDDIMAGTALNGVVRSTTVGQSWSEANAGLPARIQALHVRPAPSPTSPTRLFAGTSSAGIRYSDDDGASWSATNLSAVSVDAITQVPLNDLFFAATSAGIFASNSTGGLSWVAESGISAPATDLVWIPGLGAVAVADTVYLRSGGAWSPLQSGIESATIQAVGITPSGLPVAGAATFRGQEAMMYRLSASLVWEEIGQDIASRPDVLCFASDQTTLLVGTTDGIFQSADDGQSWLRVSLTLPATTVRAFLRPNGGRLIAGSDFGAFQLDASGSQWDQLQNGFLGRRIGAAAESSAGSLFLGDADVGVVLRSSDGGASWSELSAGLAPTAGVQCFVFAPGALLAGSSSGLYLSLDGGENWTLVTTGIPSDADVRDLLKTPSGRLFAATATNGLWQSDTGGQSWLPVNTLGETAFASLAVIPGGIGSVDTLFAGQIGGTIMRSQNQGANWSNLAPAAANWNDLLVDSNGVVFAASSNGVRKSADLGSSWQALDQGLEDRNCLSLGLDSGGRLHVGTFAGGVWRLP